MKRSDVGCRFWIILGLVLATSQLACGQPYGEAPNENPGDGMIQRYLARRAVRMDAQVADDIASMDHWQSNVDAWRKEYIDMLGLSVEEVLQPRTTPPFKITGELVGEGFLVEKLHYQSRPGLYVTANLYRPSASVLEQMKLTGQRLPTILYVCGHSGMGRNGNKTAFQTHGIWFARHGYNCLVVDTLQLGEIAAKHHGTYNLERWWWHSRGYTPAGVECLNGIRGIDYLISRPDVDSDRIAVTGISGGGAASFWIAAADTRVKVAVPVSGMADLESYLGNRVINGHCDCMFLYNRHRWPWTRIACLVAPRPMLFANSDQDPIFPMDANERISNRMERMYSLFGASDRFDTLVSIGGHAYRADIRRGVYGFINAHLRGDARYVVDGEVDAHAESGRTDDFPIQPESLRVFPTDADLPRDQLNTEIDKHFVAQHAAPVFDPQWNGQQVQQWCEQVRSRIQNGPLKELSQASNAEPEFPMVVQEAADRITLSSEEDVQFQLESVQKGTNERTVLVVQTSEDASRRDWWKRYSNPGDQVYVCMPRGIGPTKWTRKNPPNYVERSHVLLGTTVDTGRVRDVLTSIRFILSKNPSTKVHLIGSGPGAGLVAFAGLLQDPVKLGSIILVEPPLSHYEDGAPQFLGILRECDIPTSLAGLTPQPLMIVCATSEQATAFAHLQQVYAGLGHGENFKLLTPKP